VLELERLDKTVDLENGFQVIRYKSTSGDAYRDSSQVVTDPGEQLERSEAIERLERLERLDLYWS
jgi:hypothetical protein